eukprot:SAG31_NODE_2264_length_6057_cov_6.828634_1_plen_367_part_00
MSRSNIFLNPYTNNTRISKSFMILNLASGRNAWEVLGLPSPLCPKNSTIRGTPETSRPPITVIKLPLIIPDILHNPVLDGIKSQGLGRHDHPLVRMFDNEGYDLISDPNTGDLKRGHRALPDILRALDITRQPEIDYDSAESQIDRLANAPRDFIGRKVYQYFPHAIPPGKYEGTVEAHTFDTDDGHFWRIHWPAIGNNESDASDYQQEEMIEYCIHANDDDVILPDSQLLCIEDSTLHRPLSDFDVYSCKEGESFASICDAIIPRSERRLYAEWLQLTFGYGPMDSDHPDAMKFTAPFDTGGKLVKGIKGRNSSKSVSALSCPAGQASSAAGGARRTGCPTRGRRGSMTTRSPRTASSESCPRQS